MQEISQDEFDLILRYDFVSFISRSFIELNPQTDLLMGWYIEAMAAKLEACLQGKIKRFIINLPPRYLKSHCTSIAFVAFWLGHYPAAQIICASYGQDLANKLARDCRRIMASQWYKRVFDTRLSQAKNSVNDFMTTDQGFRMATSVGGVLTGRGADLILIDDPLKPDEALSEVQRKTVNEWYSNTLISRLNSKKSGCIIIIMQRLHQDDLVGHVCQQEDWDILSFPVIATKEEIYNYDVLGYKKAYTRRIGEPLHAEREPLELLEKLRQTSGDYNFQSQYQQSPTPPGGALVKTNWLKFYIPGEQPAKFDQVVQSWDTANKASELNDYSVCTTWGLKSPYYYLLHVFRRRMEFPDLKRSVFEQAQLYKPSVILIEDKASGTQLLQELINSGLSSVKAFQPSSGDKIMRLHAQTATFENGFIFLPQTASWLDDYINEITGFPGARYDDQVDSTSQFLAWSKAPYPGKGFLDYIMQANSEHFNQL